MIKKTILSIIAVSVLSPLVAAADLPQAGTINSGLQVSSGNIDHKSFSNDDDGIAQVMLYADYYFTPGWAIEIGVNKGSNIQDWICKNDDIDLDEEYCNAGDDASSNSPESDLDFTNFIVAVRLDNKVSENSFIYGKLGFQYFDYEMTDNNSHVFKEETGTGIYSELGWQYQWSNNVNMNVGYQHISMGNLTTRSLALGVGYRF
ncbi:MAG: porin family protein [Colwellia sp.]